MIVTFVARSTKFPSGGVLAIYEFANGLRRRGHEVHVVHRGNVLMGGWVTSLDDLEWCTFEGGIEHHWADFWARDDYPEAEFIFQYDESFPVSAGLPLIFVQGDLIGAGRQSDRMLRPCPKVCVARWLVEYGLGVGVPAHELVHVPYGIRHEKYRVTVPIDRRPVQVAMLYHPHPRKGASFGIEALTQVKQRVPDVRAVLFGTYERADEIPGWVEYRRLPDQRELVEEVYNRSRVFVQPSIREGFGFTAVEAMAGGCALVTTDNGGSSDYGIHDQTALVTRPRDAAGMAQAVEALLVDDERRVRLATQGNEYVRREFDWDESARRLEAFLSTYGADPERYRNGRR